jgi:hypothetical protein
MSRGSGDGWVTVRIKKPLLKRIRTFIDKNERFGYGTASSFIEDAIRRRLEEIEKERTGR